MKTMAVAEAKSHFSVCVRHDLELVTGNTRLFERIPELRISRTLADSRT